MQTKEPTRQSNFELLRIVCMFAILCLHVLHHGCSKLALSSGADILSQAQMGEMLKNVAAGAVPEVTQKEEEKVKEYDFRAPKKFTKEQIKVLDGIFENYARLLSSYLTGLLRLYCRVSLVNIEEQRYSEFNNALPDTS